MPLFPERAIDGPAPPAVPTVPLRATRAWVLSLLAPGAGQLYCGARMIAQVVLLMRVS